MDSNTKETKRLPPLYQRFREVLREYGLNYSSPIAQTATAFRHIPKPDQDRMLNVYREKYPKLYAVLMEIKQVDEILG